MNSPDGDVANFPNPQYLVPHHAAHHMPHFFNNPFRKPNVGYMFARGPADGILEIWPECEFSVC